jgi:hypothetical protein
LQEKEAQVAKNRVEKLDKIKLKLEHKQRHARMVVERKKALASSEAPQYSGLKTAAGFRSKVGIVDETDSGVGGFSRGGSGNSIRSSALELNTLI